MIVCEYLLKVMTQTLVFSAPLSLLHYVFFHGLNTTN